jgi:uncharacterized protein
VRYALLHNALLRNAYLRSTFCDIYTNVQNYMSQRLNPFQFGRELGPAELVDRKVELAMIADTFTCRGKLFLIGPRRYGKTSILRVASAVAEQTDGCVLRYDAQAFPTISDLAERIASDSVQRLTSSVERAGKAVLEFFGSVRPTASFDPLDGKWSLALAGAQNRSEGGVLLADVLDGVERAAARSKRMIAIVIDEFQEVVEHGGASAEAQIRSAIQRHRHVAYVFAGSKTRLLADMVSDASRPFYRLGSVHFLGPIPREDFVEFLRTSFRRDSLNITDEGVIAILDLAADVPYNVQALASACWDRATALMQSHAVKLPIMIDRAFVTAVRDAEARRLDPLYTQMWSDLTAPQRQALLALILNTGTGLTATVTAAKYRLPVSTMQRALLSLEKKLIIRNDPSGDRSRYRFEDPLFQAWVALVTAR